MAGDKIVSGIIMFPSLKGYSYGLSLLLLASLFVFGFGNSGNFFGVDAEAEMLARVFTNDPNVPQVKDEDLLRIYEVFHQAALDRDIRSSVVIYKLASRQRSKDEDE